MMIALAIAMEPWWQQTRGRWQEEVNVAEFQGLLSSAPPPSGQMPAPLHKLAPQHLKFEVRSLLFQHLTSGDFSCTDTGLLPLIVSSK
jgi:hypothetical protein